MKVKRQPEDFRVEELPLVSASDQGRFTFYRLTKSGMGTPEAIEAIRRRWNLGQSQFGYGGLKDRHAVTVQYLTIRDGPNRALRETSLSLEPLGRLAHPYGPRDFQGNRFSLIIRDLTGEAAARAHRAAEELPRDGLPNYFDDQRFGSVGDSGEFIAAAWLRGDHERALWLALAEPNIADRPDTKEEKAILRDVWRDWPVAKARLGRSHTRSLVTYLVDHPADFRGAFARIRRDLRSLYFSAYQSYLWNGLLGRLIERSTTPEQRIAINFRVATLPLHHGLSAEQAESLASWRIPLPASRTPLPEGPARELALEVLGPLGLAWQDLRVKHLKDVFFSKGARPALFFPESFRYRIEEDDLYPKRSKMLLSFDLPKGAYATLVVKRLTEVG
jgi:tRNA pseudouridine13 synthase